MSRTFFFIAFLALVLALTAEADFPTEKRPRQHGLGFPPADAPGPHHPLLDCNFPGGGGFPGGRHGRGFPGGRHGHPFAHPPVEAGAPEESHHHHRHFFPGHPGEPGHYNHHNGGHFFGNGKPMQPADQATYMPPRH